MPPPIMLPPPTPPGPLPLLESRVGPEDSWGVLFIRGPRSEEKQREMDGGTGKEIKRKEGKTDDRSSKRRRERGTGNGRLRDEEEKEKEKQTGKMVEETEK